MKTLPFIISLILLFTILFSCENRNEAMLDKIDLLVPQKPDSALVIMESIPTKDFNKAQTARFLLLKAKATDKAHHQLDMDSTLAEIAKLYQGRGDSLEVQSLFYYGRSLLNNGHDAEALAAFTLSYDLANKMDDHRYAGLCARNLHHIYASILIIEEELNWAKIEKAHFEKAGLTDHSAWADIDLMQALYRNDLLEESNHVIDGIDKNWMREDYQFRVLVKANKALNLFDEKKYDGVLQIYADQQEDGVPLNSSQWCRASECLHNMDDIPSALASLDSAKKYSYTFLDSVRIDRVESLLKARQGDYRNAFESAYRFGMNICRDGERTQHQPIVVELTRTLRKNYNLQKDVNSSLHKTNVLLIVLSATSVFIIILLTLWIISRNRLYRQRMETLNIQSEVVGNDLREMDNDIRSILTTPLRVMDNLIQDISLSHSIRKSKGAETQLKDILQLIRSEKTFMDLEEYINANDDGWMQRFNSMYPDLTEYNRKIVILIYLGFSSASIAFLCDKSIQAIQTQKSRLKKIITQNNSDDNRIITRRLGFSD